jgi:hypothetical protein
MSRAHPPRARALRHLGWPIRRGTCHPAAYSPPDRGRTDTRLSIELISDGTPGDLWPHRPGRSGWPPSFSLNAHQTTAERATAMGPCTVRVGDGEPMLIRDAAVQWRRPDTPRTATPFVRPLNLLVGRLPPRQARQRHADRCAATPFTAEQRTPRTVSGSVVGEQTAAAARGGYPLTRRLDPPDSNLRHRRPHRHRRGQRRAEVDSDDGRGGAERV